MKISGFFSAIVLMIVSVTGCGSSNAQMAVSEQTIAAKVKKSYPTYVIVSTHKEQRDGDDVYAVETKEGQDRRSFVYSEKGVLIEMIQGMQTTQLPLEITKSVKAQYPAGTVFAAQKITRGKVVTFQLGVRSDGRRVEMILDAKGKSILR
jgi:hypothetical protein